MKNYSKWLLVAVLVAIVLFILPSVLRVFFPVFGYGMGMHRSALAWGAPVFMGMGLMWLIPLGVVALLVLGIFLLAGRTGQKPVPGARLECQSCGEALEADWKVCPHCGTEI